MLLMTLVALAFFFVADIEQQPTPPAPPPAAKAPVMTKPPALLTQVPVVYPDAARTEKRVGDVTLLITIDATGAVSNVAVKTSSQSDDLDQAAVDAAKQFTFTPAEFDGTPGPCAIEYVQHFTLDSENASAPAPEETPAASTPSVNATATTKPIAIAGVVRAAVTKQPIGDIEISIDTSDVLATTDAEGRYELRDIKPGEHRVTMAGSGWITSFVDVTVEADKRTDVIAYLEPSEGNTFETVVKEKRAQSEVTRVSLSRDEVKSVPGTFGDPLRVLENLPGMARSAFAGGQLIVRGSNPEDSSVLFDGIPIPQLYHFQGLKSVVNPEFLEDISFYPGGFPAKYGRATGGVVDVSSRELPPDAFRGAVDVSLLDADFFLSLPLDQLGVAHTTVALAARRSYIDALLPTALSLVAPLGRGGQSIVAAPVYWDYQAKLETKLDAHTVSLFAFGSSDSLKVESQGLGNNTNLSLNTGNQFHRLALRWKWRIADGIENIAQPFVGIDNTTVAGGGAGLSLGVDGGAYSWGARDELRMKPLDGVRASIGLDYLGGSSSSDVNIPFSPTFGGFPAVVAAPSENGQEIKSDIAKNSIALWAQTEIDVVAGLMIVPGVRAELTRVQFAPEIDATNGTSTVGQITDLSAVDPRVAVRWEVLPKLTTLKASGGLYHETPTDSELNQNGKLLQPTAMQLIAGVEQKLTDDLHLDFEGYITDRYYLVQTAGGGGGGGAFGGGGAINAVGAGALRAGVAGSSTTPDSGGTGWTEGVELLLRHDISKYFYGWVAYTLSRTTVDTDLNSNTQNLSAFDQTHILTVVAQGKLPWGFSLGGRFRYVTGDPTDVPAGSFHDEDTGRYTKLSSGTQSRLPAFVQLDARVDKRFTFDNLAFTAYVDCQNVTNTQNVEGAITDFRNVQSQIIPGLPILPIVGVSGEF